MDIQREVISSLKYRFQENFKDILKETEFIAEGVEIKNIQFSSRTRIRPPQKCKILK